MPATKITPSNCKEFVEGNKDTLLVLVFDADYTDQRDIVDGAIKALEESAQLKGKILLGTVDAEENNDLTTEFSILSVPMIALVRGGKTVKKIDTLEPAKLVDIVKEELWRHSMISGGEQVTEGGSDPVDSKQSFNDYLKKLTSRAPVMIFMKGEPRAPRCGFSRQLVELLSKYNIKYDTFDILQDEDVRQGLKELSDWPTYPQIYAKGEFVGGLDILKQLDEAGELEAALSV